MPVQDKMTKKEVSAYEAAHQWIKWWYGRPPACEQCDNPNNYRYEWANISGEYKRERSDWIRLCQGCHSKMDRGNRCLNGHEFTEETTRINSDGTRACKLCQAIYYKMKVITRKIESELNITLSEEQKEVFKKELGIGYQRNTIAEDFIKNYKNGTVV